MATVTLRPAGVGDFNTCVPTVSPNWDQVNDIVADDMSSTITLDPNAEIVSKDLYTIETNSIGVSDVISQIEIFLVLISSENKFGDGLFATYLKENSTYTIGNTYYQGSSVFSTFSQVYTLKPSNSTAWTKSDIDNLQIGAIADGGGPGFSTITQMYVVVTYTPSAGGTTAVKPIMMMLETDD